jgi:phosphate acetyltransferase
MKKYIQLYYNLLIQSSSSMPLLKTAVVHPTDDFSLKSAITSAKENIIDPVFIGPRQKIEKIALANNLDISGYEIYNTPHSHASAEQATLLALDKQVQAIMKGKLQTSELMGAVLKNLKTEKRISHVMIMVIDGYSKPLFLTDVAINIFPNLTDKKDIIQNAIHLFQALRNKKPKVAIISATEMINEKIPSTLDAAALCKMADRGQITGGVLDGPLGFDNAISKEAAKAKDILSTVAGNADIIVVPNLESGNFLYKQMVFLSNAIGVGIVLGAQVPVILTSRADHSELSHNASCAVAKIFIHKRDHVDIQETCSSVIKFS